MASIEGGGGQELCYGYGEDILLPSPGLKPPHLMHIEIDHGHHVVVVVEVIVLWLCRRGGGCLEVDLLGAWRKTWRGSQLANKTPGPATAVASPGTLHSKCQGCQAQASQQSMRCHKPASKLT